MYHPWSFRIVAVDRHTDLGVRVVPSRESLTDTYFGPDSPDMVHFVSSYPRILYHVQELFNVSVSMFPIGCFPLYKIHSLFIVFQRDFEFLFNLPRDVRLTDDTKLTGTVLRGALN